jgi:hypothetical protein
LSVTAVVREELEAFRGFRAFNQSRVYSNADRQYHRKRYHRIQIQLINLESMYYGTASTSGLPDSRLIVVRNIADCS